MRRIYLGRHLYGFAAIVFAGISFIWHDFGAPWQQIRALGNIPHRETLVSPSMDAVSRTAQC